MSGVLGIFLIPPAPEHPKYVYTGLGLGLGLKGRAAMPCTRNSSYALGWWPAHTVDGRNPAPPQVPKVIGITVVEGP